jgi:hypothetical protein
LCGCLWNYVFSSNRKSMITPQQKDWRSDFMDLLSTSNVYDHTNAKQRKFMTDFISTLLEETRKETKAEVVELAESMFHDERPLDVFTGEPVETYGYEQTHNNALKGLITHLTN